MEWRFVGCILACVVGAALIALALIGYVFFRLALYKPGKRAAKPMPIPQDEAGRARRLRFARNEAWYWARPIRALSIMSDDGLTLRADFIPADTETDRVAIVIHGWTSTRLYMCAYARMFSEMGYHVLLPDLRAHGASDGVYSGFGWLDRMDVVKWAREAVSLGGRRIVLMGVSMGAATVMNATGEALPPEVRCAIADCGFSSVREEFENYLTITLKRVPVIFRRMILCAGSVWTRVKAGFSVGEASCVRQLQKSRTPTLFIHGTADHFVPYAMLDQVADACAAEKRVLRVENAAHAESEEADPKAYESAVRGMLNDYIGA